MVYNFPKTSIHHLKNIFPKEEMHYQYQEIDFYFKPSSITKSIVICFHGAIRPSISVPVFRGYNFQLENSDILSFSDKLIEKYRKDKLFMGWFLNSPENNYTSIYMNIIQYFLNKKSYKTILFYGASAGGFPALYFASRFQKKCLIGNPQVFLEKYGYYKKFCKIVGLQTIPYIHDISNVFKKFGVPKQIIYYQNILDKYHFETQAKPFHKWMKQNYPNANLKMNYFSKSCPQKNCHHIHSPMPTSLVISKHLND